MASDVVVLFERDRDRGKLRRSFCLCSPGLLRYKFEYSYIVMTAHDVFVHSGVRFGIGEFGETSEIGGFRSLERI